MKTVNNLYPDIYAFENIYKSYLKSRRNKRYKNEVLKFSYHLEENLLDIHNSLVSELYTPAGYKEFFVYDPKLRLILALPFRDRVVHQAITRVIEPVLEKTFIEDSFACRKNKGALAGIKKVTRNINKLAVNSKQIYCLKMDVRKFFYSIDHDVLKRILRKKIRCRKTLALLDTIIDSTDNPGIPVGNITSQLFANVYLNELDHFIKETLRVKHYVRYMDDMVILSSDKETLWRWYYEIKIFLDGLKLQLNQKTAIFPIEKGIDFLGYRQYLNNRILRKRILKKNFKKFKNFANKAVAEESIYRSLQSFMGSLKHCNSKKVCNKLIKLLGDDKWTTVILGRPATVPTN